MMRILGDYLELARRKHLCMDVGFPCVIAIIVAVILSCTNASVSQELKAMASFINVAITAFSIMAGFNATSLSIFATSDSPMARTLKQKRIKDTNRTQMEQILAYFSWSVIVQLVLLFLGMIMSILLSYGLVQFEGRLSSFAVSSLTTFGVLYAIALTLRNVAILYQFLVADSRVDDSFCPEGGRG